jgi:acetolactate synthase I/II/III large subunit
MQHFDHSKPITGAESLMRTLAAAGVEVCFANPGTSEMHFLSALGKLPQIRPVLGLFEGAVTGMADGYARIQGKPAVTLLHLGTGFANGIANLHNASRAMSPVVNIVGDHSTSHKRWDSPLKSDVAAIARPISDWMRMSDSAHTVSADGASAMVAACSPPGRIATLILPADVAWGTTAGFCPPHPMPIPAPPDEQAIRRVADVLRERGRGSVILVRAAGGEHRGLKALERICRSVGARPMLDMVAARAWVGAGLFPIPRIAYRAEVAAAALQGISDLILVGTHPPVAPFGYPQYPSWLTPEHTTLTYLAHEHQDEVLVLEALADHLKAPSVSGTQPRSTRERPNGPLDATSIGRSIARHLPDDAILSEEAISNGPALALETMHAAPHLHMTVTGGALGQGIPVATGAAIAAPSRKVVNVQADGSAMFTLQALWTQAREKLDVVTIILANRCYAVLRAEVERVGAHIESASASALLDIGNPAIDWVLLARGMGVEAMRAETAQQFDDCLATAMRQRGPILIEAVMTL